ncbi:FecR domain-containing protein [Prosthecobacter sp.]|uniref:FecR domain-containing protein n=1 Tax=Prosthecobacter sp. TaxID=1965333 RepID=UPI002489056E|nr:FecR domain-containing protein [Prosthecobacter sp.]MDI1311302.1 FecR domain-containing protein [Prosthecobacter sp.]
MKQGSLLLSLVAVMQSTALTAGSITVSSGNVQTAGNQVITGSNARAQATVDQRGSVVRLGSNTSAQVGDRGDVSLSKGVVLISSGAGFLRRPAVQVTTPQGDVTVRGSAIVAALPDGSVKMTCLEGSLRGDLGGQSMALNPGHLIVQRPEGTRDTVQVNLNTLTHSSTLLDSASFKQPLHAAPEISQEVAQQARAIGATLTLAHNDAASTQKITLGNATELKTAEAKSDGPSLLTRIFGGGTSGSQTGGNSHAAGTSMSLQGGNQSQAQTVNVISASQASSLRISGEVSGSNVFLASTGTAGGISPAASISQGAEGHLHRLTVTPNAPTSSQLVLSNGNTQQIVNQGGVTLAGNVNALSGASLVRAGPGTLAISSGQTFQGATLTSGTLVLQGAAAQQFTNGTLSVTNSVGATITPSVSGGVLTFQPTNVGTAAPAGAP